MSVKPLQNIHPTAILSGDVKLGEGVEIGPYTIIEGEVTIGSGSIIGPHVVIKGPTVLGRDCRVYQFASIGEVPQDLKFKGERTELIIGDGNVIREYVTLNRGTQGGGGKTILGNENFIMAYVHIAHDCHIGNQNILANTATLAGHVTIQNFTTIGAFVAVHQFTRIGSYAFVSGMTAVRMDIVPFVKVSGDKAKLYGLNIIGLQRRGISEEAIAALKKAYKWVFRSQERMTEAIKRIEGDAIWVFPEVQKLVAFLKTSNRGICR